MSTAKFVPVPYVANGKDAAYVGMINGTFKPMDTATFNAAVWKFPWADETFEASLKNGVTEIQFIFFKFDDFYHLLETMEYQYDTGDYKFTAKLVCVSEGLDKYRAYSPKQLHDSVIPECVAHTIFKKIQQRGNPDKMAYSSTVTKYGASGFTFEFKVNVPPEEEIASFTVKGEHRIAAIKKIYDRLYDEDLVLHTIHKVQTMDDEMTPANVRENWLMEVDRSKLIRALKDQVIASDDQKEEANYLHEVFATFLDDTINHLKDEQDKEIEAAKANPNQLANPYVVSIRKMCHDCGHLKFEDNPCECNTRHYPSDDDAADHVYDEISEPEEN